MKLTRTTRRRFLLGLFLGTPWVVIADLRLIEPTWLKVRQIQLTREKPMHRLIHFTDLHYKGDRDYGNALVKRINALSPDFVCFTGDLIEESKFLPEALEILSGIKAPLYGVPGNHDYWSKVSFETIAKTFEASGGAWLMDDHRSVAGGKINLIGASCATHRQAPVATRPDAKNVLLMHYPAWVNQLGELKLDLMLAGHSHGGQVRIPFFGPIMVPFGVGEYDLGLFQTPCGPLYVNPGIGWFPVPLRFNCRPEITVFEI
jgi:uncharacterized protein